MTAAEIFNQNNGDVTKAYYAAMNAKGYGGMLAVALFRAQKRSTAAKKYRGRAYKRDAYDVKNWSLGQICMILQRGNFGYPWGWQRDPGTPGYEWVLYVDLPTGQCSFHSAERLDGPAYTGHWNGRHDSRENILAFCDSIDDQHHRQGEREYADVH